MRHLNLYLYVICCALLASCVPGKANENTMTANQAIGSNHTPGAHLSVDDLLTQELSKYLAYPAIASKETEKQHENWVFVCGKPVNTNGSPMDYSHTSLASQAAEGMVDDYFCALIENDASSKQPTLLELVVGSTDAPILDWIEIYDLPGDLLRSD